MLLQLAMMAASAVPPPSPSPPPPSPSPPAALLDASKCPNERYDLCGALGTYDQIRNGDRVVNAEGKMLCFTAAGDIQLGRDGTPVLQSLGLSGSGAKLVMQAEDSNLRVWPARTTRRRQ